MSTGLIITLVVFLICLSAFFSGSEIVYAAASKPRLHHEADEGSSRAKKALRIVEDYVRAIATILVGNNLVNIATASLVTLRQQPVPGEPEGGTVRGDHRHAGAADLRRDPAQDPVRRARQPAGADLCAASDRRHGVL